MPYPEGMRRGFGECGNCTRTRELYRWRTSEGDYGIACEECATEYGWLVPGGAKSC